MARVIATGGTPQHDFGRGLSTFGQSLVDFAKIREMQAQQEASNAFASALTQSMAGQQNAVPPDIQANFGDDAQQGTPGNPIRNAFAGMTTPQLGAFLRGNPGLMRDPTRLAKLMGTQEDYEYKTIGNTLVRVSKTSGKVQPVYEQADDPSKNVGFTAMEGRMFRTDKRTGEATEVARVDKPVKAQDALGQLTADHQAGLIDKASYEARKRKLTHVAGAEKDPGLISGPGGSILFKQSGELFAPGRLNVVDKDGKESTVTFSSRADMNKVMERINAGELTETDKGGRQPGSGLGEKKRADLVATRQEKSREQLSKETGGILQFSNTIKQVKKSPAGAFGLRGNVAKGLSGLVGQADPTAANALASVLSGGASEADLTTLKTNARALVSSTIAVATGEGGMDRISNAERAITEETLGIFSSLSDRTQAEAALSQLMVLKLAGMERLRIEAGLKPEFDFEKLDDVKRLHSRFMNEFGMDDATAKKAIRSQRDVRREVSPLFNE